MLSRPMFNSAASERMYVPHFYFAVHYHAFTFVNLALFEALGGLHWAPLRIGRGAWEREDEGHLWI